MSAPTLHRPSRAPARRIGRRGTAALAALGLLAAALTGPTPAGADTAGADTLSVNLAQTTGAFRGGATGTLYGFSDDGVPSQPVVDGAHITNTSQKPPDGAQHPNGDALDVESTFVHGGGKDLYVYLQDEYPDWPYNGGQRPGDANHDGVWDYLPIVRSAVEKVATESTYPKRYVFIPFNEPDGGNWYADWATMRPQFLADWSAVYSTIESVYAEHGLGHARIGGPGDAVWEQQRTDDFLTYAKAHRQLPDVVIWHELQDSSLETFRSHMDQYRALLSSLSLRSIPVDVTEYGLPHDMGNPGYLVQWLSMFEQEKIDAQTAYWNYAGNLDDNSSRTNGANAGWWLIKWYADLAGSTTVAATPPQLNAGDTLQAIAAVDGASRKATVLLGGGSNDVDLWVSGVDPAEFGSSVDVQVRADRLDGAEGSSLEPPVVLSTRATVGSDGTVAVTIPNSDPTTAYQVQITPGSTPLQPVATDLVTSTEAENATLTDAQVYYHDPSDAWSFPASGNHDVGSFDQVDSTATWTVHAPHDGTYRLRILAGANQAPGEHALFVDGAFDQIVKYAADLGWSYRGTTDVTLPLTAGTHTLSLRASKDGTTVLPGANITLDRFDLYDLTAGENTTYPATDARLGRGAALTYADAATAGSAALQGSAQATFFTAQAETGYYDLAARYTTSQESALRIIVNGQRVPVPSADAAGTWTSTARVYLPAGIDEISVTAAKGALLAGLATVRGDAQRSSDTNPVNVDRVQPGDLALQGTATVQTIPASVGSNGATDSNGDVQDVGYLGNGAGNTMTLARPAAFTRGRYVLTFGYANAERNSGINYNPQVVSRFLDVTETGGAVTRVPFRHNYSWNSFWDKSVPLTLSTDSGSLVMGNATAYGPNVNSVTLAKLVAGRAYTVQG